MGTRAANLNFFAAAEDQRELLDFLFQNTDIRMFEAYSRFDSELREFKDTSEVAEAFPIGTDPHGSGTAIFLELWSPTVVSRPDVRRITLKPGVCNGTFRYCVEGNGLMRLQLGRVHGRVLTRSHFGHQSQTRARKWNVDDGVNWETLFKLSSRIGYHVRKKLERAKVDGCPILAHALELAQGGFAFKTMIQAQWEYQLGPLINPT
ncbi:MAG: hypothetical protein AABZ53_16785 [Planctomycetota bacterium]